MADSVSFNGSGGRSGVIALVRGVVRGTTGSDPGRQQLAEGALMPGAVALLSKVLQAFEEKSAGGTGDDGIKWEPLKRSTIAQRRTTPGELKSLGISGKRTRGFLTPAEDKRWRGIFASRLAHFRSLGMDDNAAMARAGSIAWAILKASGAKTKLDVLGGRTVAIGKDTGVLVRSLNPQHKVEGQILGAGPGQIRVGSSVPYAASFHAKRPLWPKGDPATLPASWNSAVGKAVARGLLRAVAQAVAEGRIR